MSRCSSAKQSPRRVDTKLPQIERLELDGNALTSIPAEVGNLIRLEIVRLGDNRLSSVPAELGNLTNQRVLALRDNQLTRDITDPDVGNWLDANSTGWDECDNP